VPEAHCAATRHHESIAEEEGMLVSDDLPGQEKVDLAVRSWGCRRDFQPTSRMRDARDLLLIAEDDGAVVVEPDDFQDLSDAGAGDTTGRERRAVAGPLLMARLV
jgi:hypothetical protein